MHDDYITPYVPVANELPQIETEAFHFYPLGIIPQGTTVTHAQWQSAMLVIKPMAEAINWWLGELTRMGLNMGWLSDLSDGRLANITSVCRRVPMFNRRADLSFSHHEAVASLNPNEQMPMLQLAAENQWSVAKLHAKITAMRIDGALTTHSRARSHRGIIHSASAVITAFDPHSGIISFRITDTDLLDFDDIPPGAEIRLSVTVALDPEPV